MDIKKLSPAERKEAMSQLLEAEKSDKEKRAADVQAYKALVDDMVNKQAPILADFGKSQNNIVSSTFKDFEAILNLKKELYDSSESQGSHTFTSRDGNGSIVIGWNEIIGFDGTENAGVEKIKTVIAGLSSDDEDREVLIDLLNTFMKPDKKGNLNPTRIAELQNKKDKVNKPLFTEGVDIIVNAQFKQRSSQYVRGWYRIDGENGKEIKVSFSITSNAN